MFLSGWSMLEVDELGIVLGDVPNSQPSRVKYQRQLKYTMTQWIEYVGAQKMDDDGIDMLSE